MFLAHFGLRALILRMICELQEFRDFAGYHPVREMRRRALQDTGDYIESHMGGALGVYSQRQIFDAALSRLKIDGHVLEFGVYRGGSIRYIARKRPQQTIHGFDSFEGLPEGWSGSNMDKGTFSLAGKVPTNVPGNVRLHAGWFDASLPYWLKENPGPVALLHIDCDLYSSTKVIFDLIATRLVPGSIIVFDEYFGYPHWRHHEFKAFQEFVKDHGITYEYIAYARIQVAVQITALRNDPGRRWGQPDCR